MASSTREGTVAESGAVGSEWLNPEDALVELDELSAYVTLNLMDSYSSGLIIKHFNFSIPSNADVIGVELSIKKAASRSNRIKDYEICLTTDGGASRTPSLGDDVYFWPTSLATKSYGGVVEKWGLSLTPSVVNSDDFGAYISARLASSSLNSSANIEYVTITVYYDEAPSYSSVVMVCGS